MKKQKFRNREERRTHMAQRYLKLRKNIPWAGKPMRYSTSGNSVSSYDPGLVTRMWRAIRNLMVVYPKVIAAGLIACSAYVFFRQANAVTQWAGGLAISTLAIANPEASIRYALKTHEYMAYGIAKAGGQQRVDS
jgi:hypothetical protein